MNNSYKFETIIGDKVIENSEESESTASHEYGDLNLRAKKLSEKLKRLSTEEMEKEIINEPNDQQSKEVKEILRRYSGVLGNGIGFG